MILRSSLWLSLLVLVGCGMPPRREAIPEVPPRMPYSRAVRSADASYWLVFASTPTPIPLNETFALELEVYPGRGSEPSTWPKDRVRDVEVAFNAWMPDHQHGMNVTPRIVTVGPGRFRVEGLLFHMPGEWEMHFDLTRGAITERTRATIELE